MDPALDRYDRPLRSLRISVTDRCNLRCAYCMPEPDYVWLPRREILTFEELDRLVDVFASLGATKLRLTGGEPLLRHDLAALVRRLAAKPLVDDLALTTNAVLLAQQADGLAAAGLHRVTVSLDTLRPDRFRALAKRNDLPRVLAGIEAARAAGLGADMKLNAVIMRGVNDDEMVDLLEFGRGRGIEVRFIEYMDVGGATGWASSLVCSAADILAGLRARLGAVDALPVRGSMPAARYRLADGTTFGVIASTTAPFCGACDRARLTADGTLFTCLYASRGVDLRAPLRAGASDVELAALIRGAWTLRADRGAEDRLRLAAERRPLADRDELRSRPHLEMHTRGG